MICVCAEKGERAQQSYPVTSQSVQLLRGDVSVPARQDVGLITLQWTCDENISITIVINVLALVLLGARNTY